MSNILDKLPLELFYAILDHVDIAERSPLMALSLVVSRNGASDLMPLMEMLRNPSHTPWQVVRTKELRSAVNCSAERSSVPSLELTDCTIPVHVLAYAAASTRQIDLFDVELDPFDHSVYADAPIPTPTAENQLTNCFVNASRASFLTAPAARPYFSGIKELGLRCLDPDPCQFVNHAEVLEVLGMPLPAPNLEIIRIDLRDLELDFPRKHLQPVSTSNRRPLIAGSYECLRKVDVNFHMRYPSMDKNVDKGYMESFKPYLGIDPNQREFNRNKSGMRGITDDGRRQSAAWRWLTR
ncbi:hypothetical protein FB45DRAFT_864685 [Roridomyces roridus]|uniref:Uncharacterized protein n=1 Tax=Roridomyces roridus TaxID=1738132 RepID=A0AAD7C1X8_9AGAR|nr:hypothetical protein FB45DRAFT_864685 [Roridomyces roridus]